MKEILYSRLDPDCYKHTSIKLNEEEAVYVPINLLGIHEDVPLYNDQLFHIGRINKEDIKLMCYGNSSNPIVYEYISGFNPIIASEEVNSGGKVNYYKVVVESPLNEDLEPYTAEFEDIALALGLNPMEYNIMKDLWRNANARTNNNGKEGNTQLRTYQKAVHYSKLLLKIEESK